LQPKTERGNLDKYSALDEVVQLTGDGALKAAKIQ